MDKKIAQNILLGIFVLVGCAAFVFVIFSIGDGQGFLSHQITFYAKFSDVKGLHYGSEVSLSGLNVGVVKSIDVSSDASKDLIVKFGVDKEHQPFLREDSVAMIRTAGVLGDKYIELTIGSPGSPMMKEGTFFSTMEQKDIFAKGGNLIEGVSRHFDKGGDVEQLIRNLNRVAQNLEKITNDIKKEKGLLHEAIYGSSGEKLSRSLSNLEGILKKVNSGEGTLGALINDPTVYEDLKSLLGGARRSTVLKYFMKSFIESGEKAKAKK